MGDPLALGYPGSTELAARDFCRVVGRSTALNLHSC
jgi:hypothetical protein